MELRARLARASELRRRELGLAKLALKIAARSKVLDLAAIALRRRSENFLLCRDSAEGNVSGMQADSNLSNLLLLHKNGTAQPRLSRLNSCRLLLLQSDGRLRFPPR